jgi:hypothetical protein
MATELLEQPAAKSSKLNLSATPSSRNRAIDAYRAVAMCCVALGHWLAADVRLDLNGNLTGGNALKSMTQFHILTWIFQVMPVFFCIGGFSNAASLDAHHRAGRPNGSWIRARLTRLTTPSVWLAGTWLVLYGLGTLIGQGKIAGLAAGIAAIPLWFLANYVADTALSPITLRLYRKYGKKFVGALIGLFLVGEAARFPKIHYVPQMNIVLGWLLFQIIGFAWKDGHLPKGRQLASFGLVSWTICGGLVAFGPWPLAMVSVPGVGKQFANTWPPSLALMVYGLGLCSFAIAAAPTVSRFLTKNAKAWKVVVIANTMTMTSYLWHFTALATAALLLSKTTHLLPTAVIGSGSWWLQKLPLMGAAFVVLAALVAFLSPKERKGLMGGDKSDRSAAAPVADTKVVAYLTGLCGFALAAGFEIWTTAEDKPYLAIPGMLVVIAVHFGLKQIAKMEISRN